MSQLFEQALRARLLSLSGITTIIGTSLFKSFIPQTHDLGALGPVLTYTIPTKTRGNDLSGSDKTAVARVQLDAWASPSPTYPQAELLVKQLVEAIANGINGKPATETSWGDGTCLVVSCIQAADLDADELPMMGGTDKPVYHTICEYDVRYRTSSIGFGAGGFGEFGFGEDS